MSQELERVYTIPLGKVLLSQSQHRAVRAINMIKEFARHHMKVEDIKIEEDLAHQIWAKGIRSPPRKIRVRMSKTDEGYVLVSPYEEEIESKVTPEKETPKVEDKVEEAPKKEEPAKEAPKKEEPAKEAPKKEEPAKEAPKKEEPAKEAPKKEEPAKEAPKKEEPAKEAPKKEEPAKEAPKKEDKE
ncbi:50S ribosomal protein L31 [Candidatus Nitrosopumilus sp. SW]|nr:50S ribosomal protein L31e [Candidatus Nitrosopumilus sp. SW]QDI89365.1 50S ribosomal protein L31 [Candidatus Nitrosopumilus sp. SW]